VLRYTYIARLVNNSPRFVSGLVNVPCFLAAWWLFCRFGVYGICQYLYVSEISSLWRVQLVLLEEILYAKLGTWYTFLDFKLLPRSECWILSFGWLPILCIDISEHFHLHRWCLTPHLTLPMNMVQSKSYVYWTAHHCDSWRIRGQLDVTIY